MNNYFTDIFIKRPVLASVISLLILLVGLRSLLVLPIQQYPEMKNTNIVVTTAYPGADAEVVQGFITTILSRSIASAEGIDYLSSSTQQGLSVITAHIRLNYDPNKALVNVQAALLAVSGQLPSESQQPVITKETGNQVALLYMGYTSHSMTQPQIAHYLSKTVVPALQALPGVGKVSILGSTDPAMRIWVDPQKLDVYKLTALDVANALKANNYQSAAGAVEGQYVLFNIDASTGANTVEDFNQLVIKRLKDGSLLRLQDIAKVELGAESYNSSVIADGQTAVFISVDAAPGANPLSTIQLVNKTLPDLAKSYVPGLTGKVVYDATIYISSSIKEVIKTILEATGIVILVIFLFLGSLRTVVIPIVTIPLSLIGVTSLMLAFGFSINLLTLLAMVLAIGLVVDDAIVVVENVYRHVEEGLSGFEAALKGAREIATPVITMSITLAAVYAPIAFMQGITGALFTEFAVTLALAVVLSGLIALTLSPMMCSRLLTHDISEVKFVQFIDKVFTRMRQGYERRLTQSLNYRGITLFFGGCILVASAVLALTTRSELAPDEDQGFVVLAMRAPQYANADYLKKYTHELQSIYDSIPAIGDYFIVNGAGSVTHGFAGAILKPWSERSASQSQVQSEIQTKVRQIPGLQLFAFPIPSLPGADGAPLQFVVTSLSSPKILSEVNDTLLNDARQSGKFAYIYSDLLFNQPKLSLLIDRNKAADLGVSLQDIGATLGFFLSENYVNRFNQDQSSYKVVVQLPRENRLNPEELKKITVRSQSGHMVPLSSLIAYDLKAEPSSLNQYQQLNAFTVSGMLNFGVTLKEGLDFLKQDLFQKYPSGFGVGYTGGSRQLMEESHSMGYTFAFALVIIFLVLAAQFESFRDPLIILCSVPMSLCGALFFLNAGLATLNIYTSIGLVSLVGLISKHGILIVDFANKLRESQKLSVQEAIVQAAGLRLRPILMTTAAMVFGVLPLILAKGPGAVSRFDIGLVIATGMTIGTFFTLFVVPTIYTYLTRKQRTL